MKLEKTRMILGGLVLTFSLCLLLIRFGAWTPAVSVQFLGYTVDAKGKLQGLFLVKNKGSNDVILGVLPFQVQEGADWKASDRHVYRFLSTIPAGNDMAFLWPAPTNQVTWRLPVSYWSPISDTARFQFGRLLNRLHLADGDHYFCPTIVSPPVSPKPEP